MGHLWRDRDCCGTGRCTRSAGLRPHQLGATAVKWSVGGVSSAPVSAAAARSEPVGFRWSNAHPGTSWPLHRWHLVSRARRGHACGGLLEDQDLPGRV
jgi:hypothetical protein